MEKLISPKMTIGFDSKKFANRLCDVEKEKITSMNNGA